MLREIKERARKRAQETAQKATPKQVGFLEDLLRDCGFLDRVNRNAYMSRETGREVKFVDELNFNEARRLIGLLQTRRDDARTKERAGWHPDEDD